MHWDDRKGPSGGNLERFKFKGPYDSYDHFESILWLFLLGVLQMELYQLLSFFFKEPAVSRTSGEIISKMHIVGIFKVLIYPFSWVCGGT